MRTMNEMVLFAGLIAGCTGFDLASQPSRNALDHEDAGSDQTNIDTGDAGDSSDVDVGSDAGDAGPKGYVVSTLAGTGKIGSVDGPGSVATFSSPMGIAFGPDGSLYVADDTAHKIRKVDVDGTVSTIAGTGAYGLTNGDCASATFDSPRGVAVDATGNIYVADSGNSAIRKIAPAPCQVTTLADSRFIVDDGTDQQAAFYIPNGLTLEGNLLYVADTANNKIRQVTLAGVVITLAGTGARGHDDGARLSATFADPEGIAVDPATGNMYVVEGSNNDIRKIAPDGMVSTFAGSGAAGPLIDGMGVNASFLNPNGLAIDADGNLYVTDGNNNAVRKVSPAGEVTTLAGMRELYTNKGVRGSDDGPADKATFYGPWGVAVDAKGVVYVADTVNSKIRKITPVY